MKRIIPIRFDGLMNSGGSTKPWRVVAVPEDENNLNEVAYVVKTFTSTQVKQAHNIGKEFICNALASQFDLFVPEACIIDLHNEDFKAILDDKSLDLLLSKHSGNTFASLLLDNASIINEQVKGSSFDINDCATLFAFDTLILNTDRGGYRNKPNLLVDDDGFFLIDHELSFYFIDHTNADSLDKLLENFQLNAWPNTYPKHLFYNKLKSYRGTKKHLFDTFEESLKNLNIGVIEALITELEAEQISVGESRLLITYLRTLKQNSYKFRNILTSLIA